MTNSAIWLQLEADRRINEFSIVAAPVSTDPCPLVADDISDIRAQSRERHAHRENRIAARKHERVPALRTQPRISIRWMPENPHTR